MPGIFSSDIDNAARAGVPAPAHLSADERIAYDRVSLVYAKGIGYGYQMGKLDKGGHFAAWEQPQLFSDEVRAGFRSLRNS